jgi:SAM-dependent methyltransferase
MILDACSRDHGKSPVKTTVRSLSRSVIAASSAINGLAVGAPDKMFGCLWRCGKQTALLTSPQPRLRRARYTRSVNSAGFGEEQHGVEKLSMGNHTASIRKGYDRVAAAYADHYANELRHKPLDQELLSRFAAEVKDRGDVCDMGCGPGHIARYLRDAGLAKVFGLDLSPRMVEQARQLSPDISFQVGNMLALDFRDASLAGIVAFYAIVNIPETQLATVFSEMWRVLRPGGRVLLSFHIGDETVHPDEFLGKPISMDFFFYQPIAMTKRIEAAGFAIEDVIERGPYPPEVEYQSRRAYIFALKPHLEN